MPRSLQRRKNQVAEGSIFDVSNRRNEKVEAIMADADILVMLDVSSSMAQRLGEGYDEWRPGPDGNYSSTRFSEAIRALEAIQMRYQGRVIVVPFNNYADIALGGIPSSPSGGTNMLEAFRVAKQFDGTDMRFCVISDGEPGSPDLVVEEASRFETPIDTIFIGNDGDQRGLDLLNKVSAASRGKALGKVKPEDLGETTIKLLGGRSL